jgi:hypothetical protein
VEKQMLLSGTVSKKEFGAVAATRKAATAASITSMTPKKPKELLVLQWRRRTRPRQK